ncbi:MAG: hypothetical protein AAFX76_06610 [Planctomycetota bacterium]
MDDWVIDYGLVCRGGAAGGCGYDLRTQRSSGRCPECGEAVSRSLVSAWDGLREDGVGLIFRDGFLHPGVQKLASRSPHSREALGRLCRARRFVFDACRTPRDTPVAPGRERVTAADQCRGLRDFYRLAYADDARGVLTEDGWSASAAVGVAVHQLAAFGTLSVGPDEPIAAYRDVACPSPLP